MIQVTADHLMMFTGSMIVGIVALVLGFFALRRRSGGYGSSGGSFDRLITVFIVLTTAALAMTVWDVVRGKPSLTARTLDPDAGGWKLTGRWRSIPADDRERFVKACRLLAPGENVIVTYRDRDFGAYQFAREVNDLLRSSGFSGTISSDLPAFDTPDGAPLTGIVSVSAPGRAPPVHADVLRRAFRDIGFDVRSDPNANLRGIEQERLAASLAEGAVLLLVGQPPAAAEIPDARQGKYQQAP